MEELLHYVWRHRIFPLSPLRTTDGRLLEVIDPGLRNENAGPDFFNAKIKIDETTWVGNVEVHLRSSDWARHGHGDDRAYDNVVLHVVGEADCPVFRPDGEPFPQLVLPCPDSVRSRYDALSRADSVPTCYAVVRELPRLTVHSWLAALQAERFDEKAAAIIHQLTHYVSDWEQVFFITLARNFGFGLNGDAFEAWAIRMPMHAIYKHRDNLFQIEALFLGQAGLLKKLTDDADDYYKSLYYEFAYLRHKFDLPEPLPAEQWRLLRSRPTNFPHVRLAQLAALYHTRYSLFSHLMEAPSLSTVQELLTVTAAPYWNEHFTFRHPSPRRPKVLGKQAIQLLLINTVIPFLYAYGRHTGKEQLCERASRFLEALPAEDNRIVRLWSEAGVEAASAADSQAIIQLQRAYCERRECLRCRFGYEYLKGKGGAKAR